MNSACGGRAPRDAKKLTGTRDVPRSRFQNSRPVRSDGRGRRVPACGAVRPTVPSCRAAWVEICTRTWKSNADESQKSEHVCRRGIISSTTPSADPRADDGRCGQEVFPHTTTGVSAASRIAPPPRPALRAATQRRTAAPPAAARPRSGSTTGVSRVVARRPAEHRLGHGHLVRGLLRPPQRQHRMASTIVSHGGPRQKPRCDRRPASPTASPPHRASPITYGIIHLLPHHRDLPSSSSYLPPKTRRFHQPGPFNA